MCLVIGAVVFLVIGAVFFVLYGVVFFAAGNAGSIVICFIAGIFFCATVFIDTIISFVNDVAILFVVYFVTGAYTKGGGWEDIEYSTNIDTVCLIATELSASAEALHTTSTVSKLQLGDFWTDGLVLQNSVMCKTAGRI